MQRKLCFCANSYVEAKIYNNIPANKSFIQNSSNHNDDRNKTKNMDEEDSKNVRILMNNFSLDLNTTTYDVT